MYSELTPRVLVGGFVSRTVNVNVLSAQEVTHMVYADDLPLSPIVSGQFFTLETPGANLDLRHPTGYWDKVFGFVCKALRKEGNKLYFHTPPMTLSKPESPVAAYAGLRALGYTRIESRQRLNGLHPVIWHHDMAMDMVDLAFQEWHKTHRAHTRGLKDSILVVKETIADFDLGETLDGALEWEQ